MRGFGRFNPVSVCGYFLCTAGLAMFFPHPALTALSLLGAVTLFFVEFPRKNPLSHLYCLGLLAVMTLINPLFQHNGKTVLLIVNDNPVTLEALLYGLNAAVSVVSVIYWFRVFTNLMTSDRLLYLLGRLSPKLSLILSMALRYVPLFGKQARRVRQAQTAMGLYSGDNLPDRVRGDGRVFSVMVTWALENGIITADSMTARGYGTRKRSSFSLFRFTASDALLLGISLLLCGVCVFAGAAGALDFSFYPAFTPLIKEPLTVFALACYAFLAFLPTIIELSENIKWHCLKSAI